jgi:hypothetical protein
LLFIIKFSLSIILINKVDCGNYIFRTFVDVYQMKWQVCIIPRCKVNGLKMSQNLNIWKGHNIYNWDWKRTDLQNDCYFSVPKVVIVLSHSRFASAQIPGCAHRESLGSVYLLSTNVINTTSPFLVLPSHTKKLSWLRLVGLYLWSLVCFILAGKWLLYIWA